MKSWRPQPSPFLLVLLLMPVLSLALSGWLLAQLAARAVEVEYDPGVFLLGLALFLSLLLVGLLLYVAWGALSIRYVLDGDRLLLLCGGVRYVVPVSSLEEIHAPGDAVDWKSVVVRWRGVAGLVPGYTVREGRSEQLGRVISVATLPAQGQVYIGTPGVTFGVSPQRALTFVAELKGVLGGVGARGSGAGIFTLPGSVDDASDGIRTELYGPGVWGTALWSDVTVRRLLIAALLLNVLFFGYLSFAYGSLPPLLSLHWNAQAQVDRVGVPRELLLLPVFALAVWLANALLSLWTLRRERAVSLFLLAGSIATQLVFWAGALSIITRTEG